MGGSPRSPFADFPQDILSCVRQSSTSTVPKTTLSPSFKRRRYCAPSAPSATAVAPPSALGAGAGAGGGEERGLTVAARAGDSQPSSYCRQGVPLPAGGGQWHAGVRFHDPPGTGWGRGTGTHRALGKQSSGPAGPERKEAGGPASAAAGLCVARARHCRRRPVTMAWPLEAPRLAWTLTFVLC